MSDAELAIIASTLNDLEEILSTHSQLIESLFDQTQSVSSQERIETLKKRLEAERLKIRKHKESQKRKRDLEKLGASQSVSTEMKSKQNEGDYSSKVIPLLDQRGRLIAYLVPTGKNRMNILNAKGQIVAREIDGKTFDHAGKYMGPGRQGLRVLGMKMREGNSPSQA